MSSERTELGAVASGHPGTTAAAVEVLKAGGNAMDAAIAAALAATVCEPLLTGFGGGGIMTVREGDGRVVVLDLFSAFPGLDHGLEPREFLALTVDYGPTQQVFHAGRGSVAVPGIPTGLAHAHARWGSLPLPRLAAPAVRLARGGWTAGFATEVVTTMLMAITTLSECSAALFAPGGRPLTSGDTVRSEPMASALEDFGREGAEPFTTGRHADALLRTFGAPHGSLGPTDLAEFRAIEREPLAERHGGGTLYTPGPPCSGGPLIVFGLELLHRLTPGRDPIARALCFAAIMDETERAREEGFDRDLFEPDVLHRLLNPASLDARADRLRERLRRQPGPERAEPGPPQGSIPGNTTHISVVDAAGRAVSYTSSNGESCGTLWPGTDLPVNNFLGEADINPLGFHVGTPGRRLRTGMTPSIWVADDGRVIAFGTGGSNRIRTAMFQVLAQFLDLKLDLEEAVLFPRLHVEGHTIQVEDEGLPDGLLEALGGTNKLLARFVGRHLYFGGVHTAARHADGRLEAAGDPRRAGVGAVATAD